MTGEARADRTICLLAKIDWGHHQSYLDVFRKVLAARGFATTVTGSPLAAMSTRSPVLIMHFEQFRIWSHVVALLRAALRRRTAALVFRSQEALTGQRWTSRIKRALLGAERRSRRITMMTIVPLAILPKGERLFRSWLHDPQLWDVPLLPDTTADAALEARLRACAAGRPIIVAAGIMAEYKGMDMLAALANDAAFCRKYFLVIFGKQVATSVDKLRDAKGDCLIEDRYIADAELYALYSVADYVWSVYGPGYDQASGIFGRAVQFGAMPLVRAGSLIDSYAAYIDAPVVRVDWNASAAMIDAALMATPPERRPRVIDADANVDALIEALSPRSI